MICAVACATTITSTFTFFVLGTTRLYLYHFVSSLTLYITSSICLEPRNSNQNNKKTLRLYLKHAGYKLDLSKKLNVWEWKFTFRSNMSKFLLSQINHETLLENHTFKAITTPLHHHSSYFRSNCYLHCHLSYFKVEI